MTERAIDLTDGESNMKNDLISRAVAIERATKDHDFYKGATTPADKARRDELLNVMCWLGELPSAQPDSLVRPSARWMSVGHKSARICSHCFRDEPYKFADHDADIYDFCPHCGAKMEVSE